MKRKIEFSVTIGSSFADGFIFPVGGTYTSVSVEFETDNVTPMSDAIEALKDKIKTDYEDKPFHIWYWTWIDNPLDYWGNTEETISYGYILTGTNFNPGSTITLYGE